MCLVLIVNFTFSHDNTRPSGSKKNIWIGLVFEGKGYQIKQNVRS